MAVLPELIGIAEISRLGNTNTTTVNRWRMQAQYRFPFPVGRDRSGPLWRKDHILRWLQDRA